MNSKISIIFVLSILLFSAFMSKADDMKVYCSLGSEQYKIQINMKEKKITFYGSYRCLENEFLFKSDCQNLVIMNNVDVSFELHNYKFQNKDLSYVADSIITSYIFDLKLPRYISGKFSNNGLQFNASIMSKQVLSGGQIVLFKLMP